MKYPQPKTQMTTTIKQNKNTTTIKSANEHQQKRCILRGANAYNYKTK